MTTVMRAALTPLLVLIMVSMVMAQSSSTAGGYTGSNALICARINCGDRGVCQSDYTCQCNPTYYGDYCEKSISSGSITDGGLAGIIVGWLLAIPVLLGLAVLIRNLNDKGHFDNCTSCECTCNCCRRAPSAWQTEVASPANPLQNNPTGGAQSNSVSVRPASGGRRVSADHTELTALRRNEPTSTPTNTAATDPIAIDRLASSPVVPLSTTPTAAAAADTPEHQVLIAQVVDIMNGKMTSAAARAELSRHDWNIETTLAVLLSQGAV